MSLKHAILGFLSYQALSGYDLKKVFDRSVRFFWPANQSQIYRTLADLHSEGLVNQEVISREERLDLKIYQITAAGQAEFQRWITTPLVPQDYREAFLIQVYFGAKMTDGEALALLQNMSQELEAALGQLSEMYRFYQEKIGAAAASRDLFYNMLTLEYGIASNQAALQWIRSVQARLAGGDYSPRTLADLAG